MFKDCLTSLSCICV